MKPRSYVAALIVAALAIALAFPAPAPATFPGDNGKILVSITIDSSGDIKAVDPSNGTATTLTSGASSPAASADGTKIAFSRFGAVWVMNADGTGQTQLNQGWVTNSMPAWSPDGTQIAFISNLDDNGSKIYVMDADGQNSQRITSSLVVRNDSHPDWSPDGSFIAFSMGNDGVWKVRPDGSDLTQITTVGGASSWSPDGAKILYSAPGGPDGDLFVANADGSNPVNVTQDSTGDNARGVFSPDGGKIAFGALPGCCFLWTMNADGTGKSQLSSLQYSDIDWSPIPINGYPRPKGATPLRASLVVAFEQCTSPDLTHGPPLDSGSCSGPDPSSAQLTVGTPDANGQAAKSVGSVRYEVMVGNPSTSADEADVGLTVSVTDVRVVSDFSLSDYTGELRALAGLRITDKDNTPSPGGPGAATVADTLLGVTVPCTATPADSTIGSECSIATSADTLVPGTVKEGRRSVWGLGQVSVSDGGTDGDADTTGDNTGFLSQGILVP